MQLHESFFFILSIKKNEEHLENAFKAVRVNINKFIMQSNV